MVPEGRRLFPSLSVEENLLLGTHSERAGPWNLKRVYELFPRLHDLRHTWASWHVQGGTPLFALQELAGWETEKMVRRYAYLAAEHLAVYASNTESHDTSTAQPPDFRGTARLQVKGNQGDLWWPGVELNHRHADFQSRE